VIKFDDDAEEYFFPMEAVAEHKKVHDVEDFFRLNPYKDDAEDYNGNIAKLLLQQTIVNPIFGDTLKLMLLECEKEVNSKYMDSWGYWRVLGAISALVKAQSAPAESKDLWFFGIVEP